jgi:hypothetical protein
MYSRKTKNIPQDRECIKNSVNIERWVDDESGVKNKVPYITVVIYGCRIPRKRENGCGWWISQEFFRVVCIMAVCGGFFKLCHK